MHVVFGRMVFGLPNTTEDGRTPTTQCMSSLPLSFSFSYPSFPFIHSSVLLFSSFVLHSHCLKSDALNWITTFYARLRAMAPDISFGINYSLNEMPPSDARVMSVVDHTDYVLDEAGFTKWGMGKPTPDKWDEINTWIENIQNEGKQYHNLP